MMLIETKILCYDRKQSELGMDTEDQWMDYTFDLSEIISIRYEAVGQTAINFSSIGEDSLFVQINYDNLLSLWKELKHTTAL